MRVPVAAGLSAAATVNSLSLPVARPSGGNSTKSTSPRQIIANGTDITWRFDTQSTAFPPGAWLGFGLDMSAITPMDINSVASSVLTLNRVIKIQSGGSKQDKGGVSWLVPEGIDLNDDVSVGETSYDSFKSGEEASQKLALDATLSARYTAISGDASAAYATSKFFLKQYQYALFGFSQVMLRASFADYADMVNIPLLKQRLARIKPFDPSDYWNVQRYRSLFATIGSHVIFAADYGARMQLTVWADNSDSDVEDRFNVDVGAEFNGLTTAGKVDARVQGESQYKTFELSVQKLSSCMGGDPVASATLDGNPEAEGIFDTFTAWTQSARTQPYVMSFQTIKLWDLMSAANDSEVADRAEDVNKAFSWIVENPEEHITKARMTITSNWGEIGILTPSAYIAPDPEHPATADVFFADTKITWTSNVGVARAKQIDFIIKNDGSPIDIETSHGSAGSTAGTGSIEVQITDTRPPYVNDQIHDNNWNTQRFMACPVNPHPRVRITPGGTSAANISSIGTSQRQSSQGTR